MRYRKMLGAAALIAVTLGACGDSDEPVTAGDAVPETSVDETTSDETSGNAAGGTCLEGDEECLEAGEGLVGGDADPGNDSDSGDPLDDFGSDVDMDAARQQAQDLLGTPLDEVAESNQVRIGRVGDEERPVTMDLVPGRLTVAADEVDGVMTVVAVEIETASGVETVE